jgi:hypothetical protein
MPLPGLGTDVATVKRIVRDDPEALDMLDKALQKQDGRPETFDNIQGLEPAPTGTSRQQALRRLRKDRPDLHARVGGFEMSR